MRQTSWRKQLIKNLMKQRYAIDLKCVTENKVDNCYNMEHCGYFSQIKALNNYFLKKMPLNDGVNDKMVIKSTNPAFPSRAGGNVPCAAVPLVLPPNMRFIEKWSISHPATTQTAMFIQQASMLTQCTSPP